MTPDQLRPSAMTVACHVRAPLLLDPIDAKVETLRRLDDRGDVDGVVLRSWPEAVSLDAPGPESEVVDRFRRFERWADQQDVQLRPPFRVRERTSMADDTTRRLLVTPVLCLACYYDDALVGVYPHTDGETTRTATDAIGALVAGQLPAPLGQFHAPLDGPGAASARGRAGGTGGGAAGRDETGAAGVEASGAGRESGAGTGTGHPDRDADRALSTADCPDCEGALVNVQGILSCGDCRWTDADLGTLRSPRAKLVYLSLVDGPKSIDALRTALDLSASNTYSILRTLTERGLVEHTDDDRYRLVDRTAVAAGSPER